MNEFNCFITLTYSDEHLPEFGSLDKKAFPRFMKRMRRKEERAAKREGTVPQRFKYFACGEYGENFSRPHYHACIFGTDFPDRYLWAKRGGHETYRSPRLEKLWPYGHSEIGSLTFESAAYVARYCTKKVTGGREDDHYTREFVDEETGELVSHKVQPEFALMSRRPAIGKGWFEKYSGDVFPSDEVISRGYQSKPPRYYMDLHKEQAPHEAEKVVRERRRNRNLAEETPERLQVRKVCAEARMNLFKRKLEHAQDL